MDNEEKGHDEVLTNLRGLSQEKLLHHMLKQDKVVVHKNNFIERKTSHSHWLSAIIVK